MPRILLSVLLLFTSCPQPEETCILRPGFTEADAEAWLQSGSVLLAVNTECGAGSCVRDRTVTPGEPNATARGYCALPCDLGCPPGTRCSEVDSVRLCLHAP
jgi:hypothetical protein